MRKSFIIFLLFASSSFAQFQTWQPWLTEIGISPFADISYTASTSDSVGPAYSVERSGMDFVAGVQANIPPLYMRYGFSNLIGLTTANNDTTLSPLFANWRIGLQFPYEGTIYDLSTLFIMNILGKAKFIGIVIEGAYFKNIAGIDLFGTARGGYESLKMPDGEERSEKTMGLSLGAEWHKDFITPYFCGSITYPITDETVAIRWQVSAGIQLALPYSYVAGIPSFAYPKSFKGDFRDEK